MNLSLCACGRGDLPHHRRGMFAVPVLSDPFLGSLSAAVFLRFFLP